MSHNDFSYVWWPWGEEEEEEELPDYPLALPCNLPKPLSIIDIMRVDWLAQCFAFLFYRKQCDRQAALHCAPDKRLNVVRVGD